MAPSERAIEAAQLGETGVWDGTCKGVRVVAGALYQVGDGKTPK